MEIHRQLFQEYTKMYRLYLNRVNRKLTHFDLSVPTWSVLRLVLNEEANTVSEIATRQKIERPTVTKMIQRLKELNYVEVQSGTDRRMKIILLTTNGEQVCRRVRKSLDEYQQCLLKDLSLEEQETIVRGFHSITKRIMEDEG